MPVQGNQKTREGTGKDLKDEHMWGTCPGLDMSLSFCYLFQTRPCPGKTCPDGFHNAKRKTYDKIYKKFILQGDKTHGRPNHPVDV